MDPVVVGILRATLAFVFAGAALHKLRDPAGFSAIVRAHRLLPDALAPGVTAALIAGEGAATLALVTPGVPGRLGGGLALALLAVYSLAIGTNLARGRRDVDCGCLGPGHRQPLSGWLLVRNGALAALAAGCWLPVSSRAVSWLDAVTGLGGVVVLTLAFQAATALTATASRATGARRSA